MKEIERERERERERDVLIITTKCTNLMFSLQAVIEHRLPDIIIYAIEKRSLFVILCAKRITFVETREACDNKQTCWHTQAHTPKHTYTLTHRHTQACTLHTGHLKCSSLTAIPKITVVLPGICFYLQLKFRIELWLKCERCNSLLFKFEFY